MTITELQNAILQLNSDELNTIAALINNLVMDNWDKQIAEDFDTGRLDFLMREANEALREGDIDSWH